MSGEFVLQTIYCRCFRVTVLGPTYMLVVAVVNLSIDLHVYVLIGPTVRQTLTLLIAN